MIDLMVDLMIDLMINLMIDWNTSPFLGLHERARDTLHQFTDEGRSAPLHRRKQIAWGGDNIRHTYNIRTDIATTRLNRPSGPVGRFGEKGLIVLLEVSLVYTKIWCR